MAHAATDSAPPAEPEGETTAQPRSAVDRFFEISRHGSTVPRELRAGLTTFLAMSYIIFVNRTCSRTRSSSTASTTSSSSW